MHQYYRAWHYSTPPDWLQSSIVPITAGALKAEPNYEVRPRILSDYYLVWLISGRGMLQSGSKNMPIGGGDVYFLFPNTVHAYQTDPEDLLEMFWIGFSGISAGNIIKRTGLTPSHPVYSTFGKPEIIRSLQNLSQIREEDSLSSYLDACGKLLSVLGNFLPEQTAHYQSHPNSHHSSLATIAHNYINTHYSESISVGDLSKRLGVSRVTLTKLFHSELGQSPTEYIQYVRMKHAITRLTETQLPICEIARRVGYSDPLYFSKAFSKYYGVSPSRFRALSKTSAIPF